MKFFRISGPGLPSIVGCNGWPNTWMAEYLDGQMSGPAGVLAFTESRASHSRLPGRLTRDSRFRPPFRKKSIFYRKIDFFIVRIIGKKSRTFRIYNTRKNPIKPTFRKKSIEKMILINFQPFQKQIKVLTKFHNFKPPEIKKKFSAAGGLP